MTDRTVESIDFEIYLLTGMKCERLVRAKMKEIGLTESRAHAIRESVSPITKLDTGQFARVRQILAPADNHGTDAEISHRLQLWPGFDFVIAPGRMGFLGKARFERSSGIVGPRVESPEELEPWNLTIAELSAAFGPLRDGDHWPPYEEYLFRDSFGNEYGAGFSWGLLQEVEAL
ncbi:hypothetical protein ACFWPH_05755 [Nocardia sp. NPDC058499]|uniref:hypothetical protein n=1 Tax=Nocardia sp. NPDC058499 TaxID=3346530 RepID=UPI003661AF43